MSWASNNTTKVSRNNSLTAPPSLRRNQSANSFSTLTSPVVTQYLLGMSDPVSITASVITVLQLASTATTYLKNIRHGSSGRVKLRDELRNTTCLLEMLKDRIEDAEDAGADLEAVEYTSMKSLSGPDGSLTLFRRVLEDIVVKISPQDTLRQRALPFIWPFAKTDVAEMLACLERLKSNFSLIMQSDLVYVMCPEHQAQL